MTRSTLSVSAAVTAVLAASAAHAQSASDLIVSGTTYQDVGQVATLQVGSELAPAQSNKNGLTFTPATAVATGQYQSVFLNDGPDASFGVTSQIFLQNYATGSLVNVDAGAVVGSFSSKSELALNVSSDGSAITFMAYNPTQSFSSAAGGAGTSGVAAVTVGGSNNLGLIDISNSNTPGLTDPTNGVNAAAYRSVAQVNIASLLSAATGSTLSNGSGLSVTNTNAYSGNNGRAVVEINGQYYLAGNAGNSGKYSTAIPFTQLTQNTGVQTIAAGSTNPTSTVVGTCTGTAGSATGYQCGFNLNPPDKSGKDDNFRGLTAANGNLYVSKGSGSNGVNTVYQVSNYANPASATISVMPGFPTTGATGTPFGMWFANSTTLYVAYEGSDSTATAAGTLLGQGGLTKYVFDGTNWVAKYSISAGLNSFNDGVAVGADTSATTFYADGLRNITGRVNADGSVTIYGVTSTVTDSGAGANWDQGANPDQIVALNDTLSATTAAVNEAFTTLETSALGSVYRGVALAPVPLPGAALLLLSGLGGLVGVRGRRRPGDQSVSAST